MDKNDALILAIHYMRREKDLKNEWRALHDLAVGTTDATPGTFGAHVSGIGYASACGPEIKGHLRNLTQMANTAADTSLEFWRISGRKIITWRRQRERFIDDRS